MGDEHGRNTIGLRPHRPKPWLYITEDHDQSIALLRGDGATRVVDVFESMGGVYEQFTGTWSRSMRGWVIPLRFVPDVEAYCQNEHQLCVASERKDVSR